MMRFEEDIPQKAQALIDILIKENNNIERGIISKEVVAAAKELRICLEKFQKEKLEQSKTEE